MVEIPSMLRQAEHAALSKIVLSGSVLDVGGSKKSAYPSLMQGSYTLTTVNIDPKALPDITADLERPLPLPAAGYDVALLINVLEHIYEYRQLLRECVRVLKPDGRMVIVMPFLFPVHPSPRDFWRFTHEALRRECEEAGLQKITIEPLGSGVLAARYLHIERLLPSPLRAIGYFSVRYLVLFFDALLARAALLFGKKYKPDDYALGYCLTARKST